MSFVPTGYTLQFYAHFGAVDLTVRGLGKGKNYGMFFYRKGFAGTAVKLKTGGNPCVIDTPGLNDKMPGIFPRKADFELIATPNSSLKDFFVSDDQDVFVLVTEISGPTDVQGAVHFAGYVTVWDAQEEYASAPYGMSLSAVDGLGWLASFPYLQYPSGQPNPGTHLLADYIKTCLQWLGYELPIWHSMHLVEEANWGAVNAFNIPQHPGLGVNAFYINKVNANRWYTDKGEYQSCKQVLDDICATFRLRLLQESGVWKLLCVDELPGLVSGFNAPRLRYWNTYAVDPNGTTPYAPVVEDPFRTVYKLSGQFQPMRGSKVGVQRAVPRYKVTFEYGGLNSELKNGGFIGLPGQVPQGWTRRLDANVPGSGVIIGSGTADDPYWLKIIGMKNGDPKKAFQTDQRYYNVVYQSLILDSNPGTQRKVNISGIFRNIKTKGAGLEVVAVVGYKDGNGNFVEMPNSGSLTANQIGNSFALQQSGEWGSKKKGDTVNFLHFDSIQPDDPRTFNGKNAYIAKPTDGETFSLASKPIPVYPFPGVNPVVPTAIRVTLTLWPGPDYDGRDHTGAYTLYRNIQITVEDGTLVDYDKEVLTIEVGGTSVQARKRTEEMPLRLGDQTTAVAATPKPLRPGALLRNNDTPTRRWMMANGAHVDKIQNQAARNALAMTRRQRKLFIGKLLGEPSAMAVLVGQELGGVNLFPLTHKWDMRLRTVDVRAVELPSDLDRLFDDTIDGQYQTKDGAPYPMGEGASTPAGNYVVPNVPSVPKSDRLSVLETQFGIINSRPIEAAFTPVGVVPAPLYSPVTSPASDPQFQTIS